MADVTTILKQSDIDLVRKGYDEAELNQALVNHLKDRYAGSEPYAQAILSIFYKPTPSPEDLPDCVRECCIISMLASHREPFALAVHLYIALMEGVTPEQIAKVLLLAGVYSGVDAFTDGIDVAVQTFTVLKAAPDPTSDKIIGLLHDAFAPVKPT